MKIKVEGGGWFNPETAHEFEEATSWDGHNKVSVATGSPWRHQKLYRTAKGRWVMYSWSQWQGEHASAILISEEEAFDWLMRNDHEEAIPQDFMLDNEV